MRSDFCCSASRSFAPAKPGKASREELSGSTITLTAPDGQTLIGTVVVACRPQRLSYTLGDHADKPCAYVTWELQRDPVGTAIRLYIDEIDPGGAVAEALQAAWLPALAALQAQLDAAITDRPTSA